MMNWSAANRTAMIAATHAHGDYKVDAGQRIEVVGAARRAGIMVHAQPLTKLFGMYVDRPMPAAVVNSRLDVYAQRQTLAHELGHHVLNHGMQVDFDLDATSAQRSSSGASWAASNEERTAEAFAAWFLMPRTAVRATARQLDIDQIDSADDVYRIALALGVPLATLLRHLPNVRMLSAQKSREWATVSRAQVRRRLNRGLPSLPRPTSDVWHLSEEYQLPQVVARPHDRIVVTLPSEGRPSGWRLEHAGDLMVTATTALIGGIGQTPASRFVVDVPESTSEGVESHGLVLAYADSGGLVDRLWKVTVAVADARHGVSPVWLDGKGDESR
ncbi:protein of unknown function (DUF955) [Frankia torreyi]|uniref:IrrE N-terminal-like domain-containing protein n=1 Tax=Frankia torreyi TaxID=1856 RepID=A0A0D8B5J2_9ACTN|nr:ImmA/IrrE family metallo-endopeptidase [Frankia torreyi]KJE19365.1 protein of unknown function (DUF955) [Frankia torreyi]